MTAEQKVLARLQEGSATASDLASLIGCKRRTIPPLVSRLRQREFKIMSASTGEPHNPRYTMVSGPGSLGPSFVCPGCKVTIRIGHVEDHNESCQFGPAVLESLGVNNPRRRWPNVG